MNVLVLGGTQFVGRAIVQQTLESGSEATVFNRGLSGEDVPGAVAIRGDRRNPTDVAHLATIGPWDAVVDTSGYVPLNVLQVADALRASAGRFVFMSTVSVYAGWPVKPLSEESDVLPAPPDATGHYGEDVEDGPTRYGYQKSGCEAAVASTFPGSHLITRPGVVLGPGEYVGRLPWWLSRIAAAGDVLAPGSADRSIQPVDVRDLAAFVIGAVQADRTGIYNVTAPRGQETFGDLLQACIAATGSKARLRWVSDEHLTSHGIRQWSELPLWRTSPGVWQVDSSKAHEAGLSCRPLQETVNDTWHWLLQDGHRVGSNVRSAEIGLSPEREAAVLSSLK